MKKSIEERAAEAYNNKRIEIYNLRHSAHGELFNPIPTFEEGYIQGATEQRELDYVQFQSFLSERGLLYGKYTKANGDTGYKTLDELWEYFHKEKEI